LESKSLLNLKKNGDVFKRVFKPKEGKHSISIVETMVQNQGKSVYAGHCNAIWQNLPKVDFNIYIDKDNMVIHIYDSFEKNATSVINLLSESFITELCENLKVNKKEYEFYVYMKPINGKDPHIAVYNYENDSFYLWELEKTFAYFTEIAKGERSLI